MLGHFANANMSSPLIEGTKTASAFSSKDIDILSEKIFVKIDKDFKTAKFTVEYVISSNIDGIQIPLLFYAQDYKDSFNVWVDNQSTKIQNIPKEYLLPDHSLLSGFSNLIDKSNKNEVVIYWHKYSGYLYKIYDLKYFETDIKKGLHKVKIEYISNVWIDKSGWIKEYSFRYSLAPAKFWKSFNKLEVIVEQEGQIRAIKTNLDEPNEKEIKAINTWFFNKLPAEYFELTFSPKPNKVAYLFLSIKPIGLTLIIGLILFVLHFYLIKNYRKKIFNKYSVALIIGSITIPVLLLLTYILSYTVIDNLIGEEAGNHHGYVFLSMILYPVILPIYWTIMWLIGRKIKT